MNKHLNPRTEPGHKTRFILVAAAILLLLTLSCLLWQSRTSEIRNRGGESNTTTNIGNKVTRTSDVGAKQSEEEKIAARMAIEASNRMRESGLLAPKKHVTYTLVNDAGEVTLAALELAGIDVSRKQEAQNIVDSLWSDLSDHMKKSLIYDKEKSNPDKGEVVYTIAADRDYSEKRLFEFKEELKHTFGGTEGEMLCDGLGSTNHFGWFGKLDLKIRFAESGPNDTESRTVVEFSGRDPKSGQIISGGKFALDRDTLRSHFGSIFDDVIQW